MKKKLTLSLIYAISALLPVPFVLVIIGLINNGSFSSGIKMILRHPEIIVPYILIPSVVAFISAFVLVDRIEYDPTRKNNNRNSWIITSFLIVILSLFLWAIAMVFIFQDHEKWMGFQLALIAGTMYSWALYPIGLMAGYVSWRLTIKSNE